MHATSRFKCHALFNKVFAFFQQLSPCQVAILQHLQDVAKFFMKAETTTLLKVIEQILPIDTEAWNEVHDVFNSKHSPRGVEGLKCKFNKLANKPVPTGNPNMPGDIRLAKSLKSKLFCHSGVTNLSEEEEEEEEDIEEEKVNDDNNTETVDDNYPPSPLSLTLRYKKF